jgi:hypothetical protein
MSTAPKQQRKKTGSERSTLELLSARPEVASVSKAEATSEGPSSLLPTRMLPGSILELKFIMWQCPPIAQTPTRNSEPTQQSQDSAGCKPPSRKPKDALKLIGRASEAYPRSRTNDHPWIEHSRGLESAKRDWNRHGEVA